MGRPMPVDRNDRPACCEALVHHGAADAESAPPKTVNGDIAVNGITDDSLAALRGVLRIVHHVPGRLRVRLSPAGLHRTHDMSIADLRRSIESIDGVRRLRISVPTLSAVVEYDAGVIPPQLWNGLFDGRKEDIRAALDAFATLSRTP